MRSFATRYPRVAAVLQFGALAVAVAALVLIRAGNAPAADAPAPAPAAPIPEPAPLTSADCFGGVLSADPVHCRVLQGMHDDGDMTVEAMYEGGGALWIFVAEKSRAELETIYGQIRQAGHREYLDDRSICREYIDYYGCSPGVLRVDRIVALPPSVRYDDIELYGGGAEARKKHRGWAGLKEVWPTRASLGVARGAAGAQAAATTISVAGVDTTSFPERDCSTYDPVALHKRACFAYADFPGYNIAGWLDWRGDHYHVYARPPSEDNQDSFLADIEAELRRRYSYQITEQGFTFTVLPYKYDFNQLWRWTVLLDRFAEAEGNTIGIVSARLWYNQLVKPDEYVRKAVHPVREWPGVDGYANPDAIRPTINLYTHDLDNTMAALPELLRLLKIPADAVGVVVEPNRAPDPVDVLV